MNRSELPPAVSGKRHEFTGKAGRLSYYTDGPVGTANSRPLLLIHSVNAAASAYEMRPLYEHFRGERTVFALDLPGFGFSERSDRVYSARLMTDAVHDMLAEITRIHGSHPVDVMALSLSCEFAARAATEQPGRFHSLALISPTGFDKRAPYDGPPGSNRGNAALYRVFTFPLWRRGFYGLLTTRPVIRFFLQKTWGSKQIDEGLLEYDYLTTHQPGAEHAPFYFVSGFLFSKDITRIYRQLELPVFMAHGVRGDFQDYSYKREMIGEPNWTIREYPTGALPHFEMLPALIGDYELFGSRATAGPSASHVQSESILP